MDQSSKIIYSEIRCPFCNKEQLIDNLYQDLGSKEERIFIQHHCLDCQRLFQLNVDSLDLESNEKFDKIANFITELTRFDEKGRDFEVTCLFCQNKTKMHSLIKDWQDLRFVKSVEDCCHRCFDLLMQSKTINLKEGIFEEFTPDKWRSYLLNLASSLRNIKEIILD